MKPVGHFRVGKGHIRATVGHLRQTQPQSKANLLLHCTVLGAVCEESPGVVSYFLTIVSLLLVLVTLPVSLLYTVKVVQVTSAQVDASQ